MIEIEGVLIDVEEIDPEDTAQISVRNVKALLRSVGEAADKNAEEARKTLRRAQALADTGQFKTGKHKHRLRKTRSAKRSPE